MAIFHSYVKLPEGMWNSDAWLTSRVQDVQAQMHIRDGQLPPERATASGQHMAQQGTVQTYHHVRSHQNDPKRVTCPSGFITRWAAEAIELER